MQLYTLPSSTYKNVFQIPLRAPRFCWLHSEQMDPSSAQTQIQFPIHGFLPRFPYPGCSVQWTSLMFLAWPWACLAVQAVGVWSTIPPSHWWVCRTVRPAVIACTPRTIPSPKKKRAPWTNRISIAPVTKATPRTKGDTNAQWSSATYNAFLWAGAENRPRESKDHRWWVHNGSGVIAGCHTQLIAGSGKGRRAGHITWAAVWYAHISAVQHHSVKLASLKHKGKSRMAPYPLSEVHSSLQWRMSNASPCPHQGWRLHKQHKCTEAWRAECFAMACG